MIKNLTGAMEMPGLSLSQVTDILDAAAHNLEALLIWGDPGVGKTEMVKSRRRTMTDAKGNKTEEPMVVISGSMADPTVIYGIPTISTRTFATGSADGETTDTLLMTDKKEVELIPMSWMLDMMEAQQGLIFIDEITTCPPMIQAALLKLVLEREVHGHKLPENVLIFAAANFASKIIGGSELTQPLVNRFIHVHYSPSTDDWLTGESLGWNRIYESMNRLDFAPLHPDIIESQRMKIISFISTFQGYLKNDVTDRVEGSAQFPTPRNWSRLIAISRTIDFSKGNKKERTLFCDIMDGLIGLGVSSKFFQYSDDIEIPTLKELIKNPAKSWVKVIDRGWVLMSLAAALLDHLKLTGDTGGTGTATLSSEGKLAEMKATMRALLWLVSEDCSKKMVAIRKASAGSVTEPADALARLQAEMILMGHTIFIPGDETKTIASDPDFRGYFAQLNDAITADMGNIADLMG